MSARRIRAKYPGRCHGCAGEIAVGEAVVWLPPKGRRERGLTIHQRCATDHGQRSRRGTPGAWRQNAEWMSAEEFAMVEDAMARMRPAGSGVTHSAPTEESKPSPAADSDPPGLQQGSLLAELVETRRRSMLQSPARRREW